VRCNIIDEHEKEKMKDRPSAMHKMHRYFNKIFRKLLKHSQTIMPHHQIRKDGANMAGL
jgi:hypothetical protein